MKLALDNWCTLPTPMGDFRMYDTGLEEVSVISMGDIQAVGPKPLLRVHSSCRASEVFGALDCDCADQLREAMKLMAIEGSGLIVYQHQEGRGHGLSLKIKAVKTMERDGLDTAEAFKQLELEQDIRCYPEAVTVLQQLQINEVRLISNNPRKSAFLNTHGIQTSRLNTHPNIRPENADYLQTKNAKLGHQIPLDDQLQSESPIHFYHSDQPWGEFSNFSKHAVFLSGKIWPTVEHYYQAQKFSDPMHQEQIRCCLTPMKAKTLAYQLSDQHGRNDWINVREQIMFEALKAKFEQHPDLANKLLATGDRQLIEFTEKDDFWGDSGNDSGQNRLGQLLMQVRAEIKQQSIHTETSV
ncbi:MULTISPECIES: GTP cyclohydrolase II RibA [unclassified Oceanobacter]|uniref:GTP cyclohydrolase II RibA n=2 Tax=Gammaproteobacteria TaxID=1236 RepID=UPI002732E210|nr:MULTISPECIES: GTP cyclohydrolase II RibA [unclassified Oceanobacter]MDP2609632.1 GTP cyclohydrolase II RibA [Oceanobacter sp. 1_MG-2023]MDP2612715.1 GTP cyclohydrolase II RibA [Oceanobacter sp. 2_MG-2023]